MNGETKCALGTVKQQSVTKCHKHTSLEINSRFGGCFSHTIDISQSTLSLFEGTDHECYTAEDTILPSALGAVVSLELVLLSSLLRILGIIFLILFLHSGNPNR